MSVYEYTPIDQDRPKHRAGALFTSVNTTSTHRLTTPPRPRKRRHPFREVHGRETSRDRKDLSGKGQLLSGVNTSSTRRERFALSLGEWRKVSGSSPTSWAVQSWSRHPAKCATNEGSVAHPTNA